MSKKKNRKSSNHFNHKTEGFGHERRSRANEKIKSHDLLKRKITYFTPYGASTKTDKFDKRRFSPFGPEIQRVQSTRSDGYLTNGTFLDRIRFSNPLNELPCQRRRARRQVIFALNLRRKGSGAKKHRFTFESSIICKG